MKKGGPHRKSSNGASRNKAKTRPIGRGNLPFTKLANGRPPKYEDGAAIWDASRGYFDYCERKRFLPEKAGLCFTLGISRDTYSMYRKKFPDTIKRVDAYIESSWVRRLSGQAATGAIFYLKNAFRDNFRDRNETDITSGGEKITGMIISKDK